jgi:hypothetical protein
MARLPPPLSPKVIHRRRPEVVATGPSATQCLPNSTETVLRSAPATHSLYDAFGTKVEEPPLSMALAASQTCSAPTPATPRPVAPAGTPAHDPGDSRNRPRSAAREE